MIVVLYQYNENMFDDFSIKCSMVKSKTRICFLFLKCHLVANYLVKDLFTLISFHVAKDTII